MRKFKPQVPRRSTISSLCMNTVPNDGILEPSAESAHVNREVLMGGAAYAHDRSAQHC